MPFESNIVGGPAPKGIADLGSEPQFAAMPLSAKLCWPLLLFLDNPECLLIRIFGVSLKKWETKLHQLRELIPLTLGFRLGLAAQILASLTFCGHFSHSLTCDFLLLCGGPQTTLQYSTDPAMKFNNKQSLVIR